MKKIFSLGLVCLLGFGVLCGCGDADNDDETGEDQIIGTLCTLEEAYENGWLTKENLETIAYYNNNGIMFPEYLDCEIWHPIKEAAAENLQNRENNPIPEASAKDFRLIRYYGSYSGCFVLTMDSPHESYPTDVPNILQEIGGVEFHYNDYYTRMVWKKN